MPIPIKPIALLLALFGIGISAQADDRVGGAIANRALSIPVAKPGESPAQFEPHRASGSESPRIVMLIGALELQQPVPFVRANAVDATNGSKAAYAQVDATASPSDAVNEAYPQAGNALTSPQQPGGLKPKPSEDVLEAISVSTIATEGATPESAAGKRGLDRVGLPQNRGWVLRPVCWQSSNICHQPLYFEDAMLERHGHQRLPALQPMVSGTKFMSSMILLPYLTTLHHPGENRYALGHFRPGSCAPALKDTLPWDNRAAAAQALGITGVLVGLPW